MNTRYRLGIRIVLATLLTAGALALAIGPKPPDRAIHDVTSADLSLPDFTLTQRDGRQITRDDLADRVWIAAFIFTRCKASCPRITAVMKGLQDRFAAHDVQLVSITVDPKHDTPQALSRYADSFGTDPDRWWFLTGPEATIYSLVRDGFKLAVEPMDPEDPIAAMMDISHSNKLVLVDRGNRLVGMFNAEDPAEVDTLFQKAARSDRAWLRILPAINASLNALATLLLVAAWLAIRNGRRQAHTYIMIAALSVSAAFLVCYLVYHTLIGGGTPYPGTGWVRILYFTILISHVVLAAAVVPLILITVIRAARSRFTAHKSIAQVTYPIWLYVAITGVVVYLMLYQLPAPSGGPTG